MSIKLIFLRIKKKKYLVKSNKFMDTFPVILRNVWHNASFRLVSAKKIKKRKKEREK